MIDWNGYAEESRKTAFYPGRNSKLGLLFVTLGLRGEAGEVVEHVKKFLRDDLTALTEARRDALRKELGDVCWYAAQLSHEAAFDMGQCVAVAQEPMRSPEIVPYGTLFLKLAQGSSRLHSTTATCGDLALPVMRYRLGDGDKWYERSTQGRGVRTRLITATSQIIFWVGYTAKVLEIAVQDILELNLTKLRQRAERGTLHGSGSER